MCLCVRVTLTSEAYHSHLKMLDITTLVILVIVFVLTYLYLKARVPKGLPPGPKGWPFIGHLDLIYYGNEKKMHVLTADWGKQYGGLYSMYSLIVVLLVI